MSGLNHLFSDVCGEKLKQDAASAHRKEGVWLEIQQVFSMVSQADNIILLI